MSSRAMRSHAATCEAMIQQWRLRDAPRPGRRDRWGRRDVRFDFMHWPRTPNSCLMPLIWCCFMAISVWSLALLASVPAVLKADEIPSDNLSIMLFSLGGAADICGRLMRRRAPKSCTTVTDGPVKMDGQVSSAKG